MRPAVLVWSILLLTPNAIFAQQAGDLVIGLSVDDAGRGDGNGLEDDTLWLVRDGAVVEPIAWKTVPLIQSVEFDNLQGVGHNPQGNLLGLSFGTLVAGTTLNDEGGTGGLIYSFATDGTGNSKVIGRPETGLGSSEPGSVTNTRVGGLSISPDNAKIAVTGYDNGRILIYDYSAGSGDGLSGSLSGGRQTAPLVFPDDTQGSAWLDADTVLAFSSTGDIVAVEEQGLSSQVVASVPTLGGGPGFTDLEYNPAISPYVYAMYSGFDGETNESTNSLFVLDPADEFGLVGTFQFGEDESGLPTLETARELAFAANGDLYVSQFGGVVSYIPGAADPTKIVDFTATFYFTSDPNEEGVSSSFSGIDIAVATPISSLLPGDANSDGKVDLTDFGILKDNFGTGATIAQGDFNGDGAIDLTDFGILKDNFGKGGVAAVPEPSGLLLWGVGMASLAAIAARRFRASLA